jgi:hypothetical protein
MNIVKVYSAELNYAEARSSSRRAGAAGDERREGSCGTGERKRAASSEPRSTLNSF